MLNIILNTQGVVALAILPEKSTINARYYTNTVLPEVVRNRAETARTWSGSRLLLHHDNAAPQTAAKTVLYMEEQGVQLLPHPPYFPDLTPCGFWLFPKVKKTISGRPFSRIEDLARAFFSELQTIPTSEYAGCFQSWMMRMQWCIDCDGEYFEGMWPLIFQLCNFSLNKWVSCKPFLSPLVYGTHCIILKILILKVGLLKVFWKY